MKAIFKDDPHPRPSRKDRTGRETNDTTAGPDSLWATHSAHSSVASSGFLGVFLRNISPLFVALANFSNSA